MTETIVHRPLRIFAYCIGSITLFSLLNLFVKLASETQSIAEIMFFRNALALPPLLFLIHAHPDGFGLLKTKRPFGHFTRGAIGNFGMILFFLSFALLPLADATAIQFAMPLIITALSIVVLGEKVGKWRWGAVIAGFTGILFIAAPTGTSPLGGMMVALAAAFTGACAQLMVRHLGKTEHALTIVFYFSLIGMIACGIALPFFWSVPTDQALFYMVMTGLTGGIAQVLMTKAYAEAPAGFVTPFNYLGIIYAGFFGWLVWQDVPSWNMWVGTAIIITSGLVILYRETILKIHPDPVLPDAIPPTEADAEDLEKDRAGQTAGA
ncbi:MAG TPA: DMT family transporter [Alphaproteobacteria bacterium]